jgi:predicted peptidase
LIDDLQAQYNIDPERIYVNGMSNAGLWHSNWACVMSGDRIAPYWGGKSPVVLKPLPSIPDWVAKDASQNKCQTEPVRSQVSAIAGRLAYSNCEKQC